MEEAKVVWLREEPESGEGWDLVPAQVARWGLRFEDGSVEDCIRWNTFEPEVGMRVSVACGQSCKVHEILQLPK